MLKLNKDEIRSNSYLEVTKPTKIVLIGTKPVKKSYEKKVEISSFFITKTAAFYHFKDELLPVILIFLHF